MGQSVTTMTDQRRALMTEREREILTDEADVTTNYKYSVESRIRTRLREKLKQDVDVLRTEYPEMFDDLIYSVVCEPGSVSEPRESTREPVEGITGGDTPENERDALRDELAGSGDLLDRRVNTILEMHGYLQNAGSAEKSELLDAIDVEATGYDSRESAWSNMVKGKRTLQALPGVEPPRTGMSTWRYNDEQAE